jgi:hypothetical protein
VPETVPNVVKVWKQYGFQWGGGCVLLEMVLVFREVTALGMHLYGGAILFVISLEILENELWVVGR